MKFGIIYNLTSYLVKLFYNLNIVEWFKFLVKKFTKVEENKIRNIQIAIDVFIIAKFAIVIFLWYWKANNLFVEIMIWYLIISNVFTYFYYHVWIPPFQISNDSKRRRFLNLMISILFSNLCFTILYSEFYIDWFELKKGHTKGLSSLMMSNYNSIFGSYEPLKPKHDCGYFITLIQLGISFLFLSIILSVSVPQLEKER